MNKKSILSLINTSEHLTKQDLIKKILIFIEKELEITIAFLEYDGLYPILYYLDDDMIIKLHQYNFLPQKSSKIEVIVDVLSFKDSEYFNDISLYAKTPIKVSEKDIGELIFKVDDMKSFNENKDLINKISLEIAFLLDYFELKDLKDNAIESLIKENQVSQKIEDEVLKLREEVSLLKGDNKDFGVLLLDLDLNILENNSYIEEILEIKSIKNIRISNFLTQNEIYSSKFINYLNKLSNSEVNSVTSISLISSNGKKLFFKVSGIFLKDNNKFLLKLFNTTSEIILTKKFANLKNRFDKLLEVETEDIVKTSDLVMIETLKFFENKDEDFGNHLERIAEYSLVIANYIFDNNISGEVIDIDYLNVLPRAAYLHDIGMLSIKESILFKDSKFTKEEFATVKNHTIEAANMIDKLVVKFPNSIFLKLAKEITLGHHERYDGSGYPYKLVGKQIPLSARIIAFADIFDGLTTDRIYKKGLDLDIARMMIVEYQGKLLDPDIVDIYLKNENKFIEIHKKYNLS